MKRAPRKKICKAKGCLTRFYPINSFHDSCSPVCAIKVMRQKKDQKAKDRRKIDKLRLEGIQPKSYWLKKAQRAMNKYIRKRDHHEPCISCRRHHAGQYHAGHFRSVGSGSFRFHPSNNHKQCSACNNYLSGNLIKYREFLIEKIGHELVEYLEKSSDDYILSITEVKEIEDHYKQLYKDL